MKVTYALPEKINPQERKQLRADQRLYNDVIDDLDTMKAGWMIDNLATGKSFIRALSSALWCLDPHCDTLHERGVSLPVHFDKYCGYNDFVRKKEKKPRLSQEGLNQHLQALSDFLSQPWFCRPRYAQLRHKTDKLVEGMKKYE